MSKIETSRRKVVPGWYRLCRDIENPHARARANGAVWYLQKSFRAGTVFLVSRDVDGWLDIRQAGGGRAVIHLSLLEVVFANSEPYEPRLDQIVENRGEAIVKELVKSGRITLADVMEICNRMDGVAPAESASSKSKSAPRKSASKAPGQR